MKALVIHPWHNVQESHVKALRQGFEASLRIRGIEAIFLDIAPGASSIEANEALTEVIFDLAPGDFVLWHGSAFPEVLEMVAFAMRTLAPLSIPPSMPYHFMPFGILVNLPADSWQEYQKNDLLLGGVISVLGGGLAAEDVSEGEVIEALSANK